MGEKSLQRIRTKPIIPISLLNDHAKEDGFHSLKECKKISLETPFLIVIISDIANLKKLKSIEKAKGIFQRLKGIFIECRHEESLALPEILKKLNLNKFMKYLEGPFPPDALEKIKRAWKAEGQNELIAYACLVDRQLFVVSCDFHKFLIPTRNIKALSKLSYNQLKKFQLDKWGRFLHWEDQDIHLDLEALKVAFDPTRKIKIQEERLKDDEAFGRAISRIRKNYQLRQSDIGLSDKQLRRYEHGKQRPTLKSYKIMAKAHRLSPEKYFDELSAEYHRLLG